MLRSNVRLSAQEFADLRNQVKAVRESGVPRLMYVAPPKQVFTCAWADGVYMLYDASGNQVMRSLMPQDVIGFLRTRPGINALGFLAPGFDVPEMPVMPGMPAMPEATVQAMSVSKSKSKSKSKSPTPPPVMHVPTPLPTNRKPRTVASASKARKARTARTARPTRTERKATTVAKVATIATVAPKAHRRKGVPQQAPVV